MLRTAPNKLRKRSSRPLMASARFSVNSYSSTSTFCDDQEQWVLIPSLPYPSSPRPGEAFREFGRKCKRSLSFSRTKGRELKTSLLEHRPRNRDVSAGGEKTPEYRPRYHSFLELAKEPSVRSNDKAHATQMHADTRMKSTPDLRERPSGRESADEMLIEVLAQFPCPPQMCRQPVRPGVRSHGSTASFSLPTSSAYPEVWSQSQSYSQRTVPKSNIHRSRQAGLLLHRVPAVSEVPFPSPVAY